jgi:hypothetical protein
MDTEFCMRDTSVRTNRLQPQIRLRFNESDNRWSAKYSVPTLMPVQNVRGHVQSNRSS